MLRLQLFPFSLDRSVSLYEPISFAVGYDKQPQCFSPTLSIKSNISECNQVPNKAYIFLFVLSQIVQLEQL